MFNRNNNKVINKSNNLPLGIIIVGDVAKFVLLAKELLLLLCLWVAKDITLWFIRICFGNNGNIDEDALSPECYYIIVCVMFGGFNRWQLDRTEQNIDDVILVNLCHW